MNQVPDAPSHAYSFHKAAGVLQLKSVYHQGRPAAKGPEGALLAFPFPEPVGWWKIKLPRLAQRVAVPRFW